MAINNHNDSFTVLEETIGRNTQAVCKALNLAPESIRKWKQPRATKDNFQSGSKNPLDRLEIVMKTIEEIDGNTERAHEPIKWLCTRFGYLPPIKMQIEEIEEKEILKAILGWHKEFGETCVEISKTLEDGQVTKKEYDDCYREAIEDIQALMNLLEKMKQIRV